MYWMTDEEIKELFNKTLGTTKERETITRWRNGSRSPKFAETKEIEKYLKIPFEVFLRNANLEEIEHDLVETLKNLRTLRKEEQERKELQEVLKK